MLESGLMATRRQLVLQVASAVGKSCGLLHLRYAIVELIIRSYWMRCLAAPRGAPHATEYGVNGT